MIARMVSISGGKTPLSYRLNIALPSEEPGIRTACSLLDLREIAVMPPEARRLQIMTTMALIVQVILRMGYTDDYNSDRGSTQSRIITAICEHLQATGGSQTDITYLAHMGGYSKYHFLRLFKRHTGQTVHEYINGCRLTKINTMRQKGLTNKEIASALGFSCTATYLRWLKQQR